LKATLLKKRFLLTIAILMATIFVDRGLSNIGSVPFRKDLSMFPKSLGDWQAVREDKIDEAAMKLLQVDDYVMRMYKNSKGEGIYLYRVLFFAARRKRDPFAAAVPSGFGLDSNLTENP
jgi:hypothetical protein